MPNTCRMRKIYSYKEKLSLSGHLKDFDKALLELGNIVVYETDFEGRVGVHKANKREVFGNFP